MQTPERNQVAEVVGEQTLRFVEYQLDDITHHLSHLDDTSDVRIIRSMLRTTQRAVQSALYPRGVLPARPIGEMPGNPSRSEYQEWHERNIG